MIEYLSQYVDTRIDPKRAKTVVRRFKAKGYLPGVNCGPEFRMEKENFARYIVGQGLQWLQKYGFIHPVYHRFAEDWGRYFGASSD